MNWDLYECSVVSIYRVYRHLFCLVQQNLEDQYTGQYVDTFRSSQGGEQGCDWSISCIDDGQLDRVVELDLY